AGATALRNRPYGPKWRSSPAFAVIAMRCRRLLVVVELVAFAWLLSIVLCTVIGASKGRTGEGPTLGALLAVVGLVIVCALPVRPAPAKAEGPAPREGVASPR